MTIKRRKKGKRRSIKGLIGALVLESGKVDYKNVASRNVIQTTEYLLSKYFYKARKP